ncbi:MAG TPA: phosphatase PAP2 family protein [Gemmatimonadales bacterium]|nr:phosphatase PAP2 family protein [Gemmatimonadales bacterium]
MSRRAIPLLMLLVTSIAPAACNAVDATGTDSQLSARQNAIANGLSSTGWNAQARALVALNSQSPLFAGRVYAALGVAQYAALNDVGLASSEDGRIPDNGIGEGGRHRYEAERGAVAGASVRVLSALYPAAAAALEQRVQSEANAGPGNVHPAFTRGLAIGRAAGDWMVARLASDGFTTPWGGTIPTGDGIFVPNGPPAGAALGGVMPYFLTSGAQFRSIQPPQFASAAFLAELAEIRTLSDSRTPEQLASALQWNYPNGTYTPVGYWNDLAAQYIEESGLNEREATHVFALMGATGFDALIGCWEAKYHFWYIRPWQADNGITLPIGAPNHPSYPSGHSCVSQAMADVLADFFPSKAAELGAQVTDAGLSRMYGGIHFRSDITAGEQLGRLTAQHALGIDRQQGLLSALH